MLVGFSCHQLPLQSDAFASSRSGKQTALASDPTADKNAVFFLLTSTHCRAVS